MDGSESGRRGGRAGNAQSVTLALLACRAEGATLCPSEVARALAEASGAADWRDAMAQVHEAAARMAAAGLVRLSWKGEARRVGDGPYRIGRAARRPASSGPGRGTG